MNDIHQTIEWVSKKDPDQHQIPILKTPHPITSSIQSISEQPNNSRSISSASKLTSIFKTKIQSTAKNLHQCIIVLYFAGMLRIEYKK